MTTKRERLLMFGKTLLAKLFSSLKRFPETLLICAATVTVLIILNHGNLGAGMESSESLRRLLRCWPWVSPLPLYQGFFERAPF